MAFALFPGLAVAQDSSGIQYSDAPPTPTGKSSQGDPANASNADGASGPGQSSTGAGSTGDSRSGDDEQKGGAAGGTGGDGPGKGGEGKGGTAGHGGGDDGAGNSPGTQVNPASTAADDGGSSPVVPILIALAVLGAVSFAVVAMRKRGEDADSGAPASPGAG